MEATDGPFEAVGEEGEANAGSKRSGDLGWFSPRISFSSDFATGVSESSCSNGIGRVSPEKRKWEHPSEDISTEFEFCMTDSRRNGSQDAGEIMLSADELFSDGKLRPLHLPRHRLPASDDLCLALRTPEHKHSSLSRHLSFDTTHRSSLIVPKADHLSSPHSSSPPKPALPAASTPVSPRASSKYSAKLKEFFKPKKAPLQSFKEASCAQLTRDNSITPTCRIPISPRSFWPFARSNSAGESQTTTPAVPGLPLRSNSAGESKTTTSASLIPDRTDSTAVTNPCDISSSSTAHSSFQRRSNGPAVLIARPVQNKGDPVWRPSTPAPACLRVQEFRISDIRSPSSNSLSSASSVRDESRFEASAGPIEAESSVRAGKEKLLSEERSNQIIAPDESATSLVKTSAPKSVSRVRGPGNYGRSSRRVVSSPSRNFSRSSPGRRGVLNNSGAKGNTGKIMLRNLERCKADTNVGVGRSQDLRSRSDGRDVFPVMVRVSPVINVIYRGKPSSNTRLFGFRKLFSSRKEKPLESSINNWRNGA